MNKSIKIILLFTLISSLILVFTNHFIDSIFYIILSSNYSLMDTLLVFQAVVSFVLWLIFGNILKHNIATAISNRSKIIFYIFNLITISIIIISVNYIGYILGYNPVYERNFLFSTFIGLNNDWFGTISFIAFNLLSTENQMSIQFICIDDFVAIVFIIIGVICGFNTRQIIKRSIRISNFRN